MLIVIRGEPGSGKTTICKNLINKIDDLKLRPCGFITTEIRDSKGERIGFEVQTLDGKKAIFSSVFIQSNYKVGKYRVDIGSFEKLAIPALEKFASCDCSLLIVDEVGKMELLSKNFLTKIKEVLTIHSKGSLILTLPVSNFHPLIEEISSKADWSFFTTRKNKRSEEVALKIFNLLREYHQST
ncbi:MAG: nucleoside-triphosphatase [candidate division WOR-3 bacterium]